MRKLAANLVVLFVVLFTQTLSAQQFVRGRIFDKNKDKVLSYVTVRNLSQKTSRFSDFGGNYQIKAAEGDLLIFSSVAYLADTVKVNSFMLTNSFDISLEQNPEVLQSVTVGDYNNYQLDSLSRREDYRKFYESKRTKLAGDNTPVGFGITFSPISFFSRKEKQKRKFMKLLLNNEEQYYIDFRFSANYVTRLTGLHGDSLHLFMLYARPTYAFCRKSSQEDMLFYVNDKLKQYMNKTRRNH